MDMNSQISLLNLLPSMKSNPGAPIVGSTHTRMKGFLDNHPEGIVLTDTLRRQIHLAILNPDLPICIEGETGTGKEQIVKYIHRQQNRTDTLPLVVINCANLKGDLVASTLFGHKKGAFTGATDNSVGAIGRAHNGWLFLDEFHRLDATIQEQILRTTQDGSYQRVGDLTEQYSNFRLVVATPKNLEEHALAGDILLDLRYRLYGIDIRVPPLRERFYQMSDFIDCFFAHSKRLILISPLEKSRLIQRCCDFHWQGNIRQLFGVLQTLVIQTAILGGTIEARDLPVHLTMLAPGITGQKDSKEAIEPVPTNADDELLRLVREFSSQPSDYETFLAKFEGTLLTNLVNKCQSVKSLCEATKIPRSTLHAKRQRLVRGKNPLKEGSGSTESR